MRDVSAGSAQDPSLPRPNRIPQSTYRLQFSRAFTFRDAWELTPYLHELGISDCYASPIFKARPGSTHGYDTCDFSQLNPELGTWADFERWTERLHSLGMGLLMDLVPNHMGADPCNGWWRDVLEKGEASAQAQWFDINWHSSDPTLQGKVLVPILEDRYDRVLEAGKIRVVFDEDAFWIVYYQHRFPVDPESQQWLRQEFLAEGRQEETEAVEEFRSAFETKDGRQWQRGTVANVRPSTRDLLERGLAEINGTRGNPASFDRLHQLLQQQHYRLAYWPLSSVEINYRRFFDVSELVSLRMELPEVFEASHQLVFRLLREGRVTGLRIDHPDGLRDPREYFSRLQDGVAPRSEMISVDGVSPPGCLYVVAEKILSPHEELPGDWQVSGTTGYDFLNRATALFVNSANLPALDELYYEFTRNRVDFASLVSAGKKEILNTSMQGDFLRLARLLRIAAAHTRYALDFGPEELSQGLLEVLAAFPVYRTYITEQTDTPSAEERKFIQQAIAAAAKANPRLSLAVFEFIQSLLLLSLPRDLNEAGQHLCREFVLRFQQLAGPVMAKGLEDTAFYNFNRLISLNEVGGAPGAPEGGLEAFHAHNATLVARQPHSLLATTTHDTKRGEDARARICVLSELPLEWRQAVLRWSSLNAGKKTVVGSSPAPDANDEYLLYQTLIGAWVPEAETPGGLQQFRERIAAYMLKATREAKAHTSWSDPESGYEEATRLFVDRLLTHSDPFLDDFMLFYRKVTLFGLFNSLSQLVLKMTSPGVPDFYQGTELWDHNLVDPDNRRPVDYRARQRLLSELRERFPGESQDMTGLLRGLLRNYQSGQIKLYLIWKTLELRRRQHLLFKQGDYLPIYASGAKQDYVCAFARSGPGGAVITVATRLAVGLTNGAERAALEPEVWQDTLLPIPEAARAQRYRDVLTQRMIHLGNRNELPVRDVLDLLPVAVLERLESAG